MTDERLKQIKEYREACRAGNELPDVGFAHEAIDDLLAQLAFEFEEGKSLRQQAIDSELARLEAEVKLDTLVKFLRGSDFAAHSADSVSSAIENRGGGGTPHAYNVGFAEGQIQLARKALKLIGIQPQPNNGLIPQQQ